MSFERTNGKHILDTLSVLAGKAGGPEVKLHASEFRWMQTTIEGLVAHIGKQEREIAGLTEDADALRYAEESNPGSESAGLPTDSDDFIDQVAHPAHYQRGGIETIDLLEAVLSPAEFDGFLKGNILKYRDRAGLKHGEDADKDLAKAKFYHDLLATKHYYQADK